jgi:hypothetical protein
MRAPTLLRTVLGLVFVIAAAAPGCGDGGTEATSTGTDTTTTTTGTGGGGGAGGGGGGSGGGGGAGGGSSADNGVQATETVSGGTLTKSPNYKMISTFGQPTQNQGKTTSPGYNMQGGLIGAAAGSP